MKQERRVCCRRSVIDYAGAVLERERESTRKMSLKRIRERVDVDARKTKESKRGKRRIDRNEKKEGMSEMLDKKYSTDATTPWQ